MSATTSTSECVIDLAELCGHDELPAYAALYTQNPDDPFVLSPSAMRWSRRRILSRLDECRAFWLEQKKKLRCRLDDLFGPLLEHHYGEDYIAVFGEHPWQCLLYLEYQRKHAARGLFMLPSRLDRSLYHRLGWDDWFEPQARLAGHLLAVNARGFRAESFRARQAQMRRFIERIGVDRPSAMRAADANAITRRFGKWLGHAWHWSFADSARLQGFPWRSLRHDPEARVARDLEYPHNQWSCIEVLLREDLERLAAMGTRDDSMHINRMAWQISLFNQQRITVELSFRHPYSLHRDAPDYATALYQARYRYEDLMRRLRQRDTDLDLPDSMPFNGWSIALTEVVMLSPSLWDLFAHEFDAIDYQRVMALQNKLPLAFESYQSDPSYFPEQSFAAVPLGAADSSSLDCHAWRVSAANKPLFYYPDARPIDHPGRLRRVFLERNSNQWWLGEDALQSIRDYFMLEDERGRASWVYRTRDGAWYKQGEFC